MNTIRGLGRIESSLPESLYQVFKNKEKIYLPPSSFFSFFTPNAV
jgi:hypothetical protein